MRPPSDLIGDSTGGVRVRLDQPTARYEPGERLRATVTLEPLPSVAFKAIEVSVVWYTSGQGDEDLHVHEFFRETVPTPAQPCAGVSTRLPRSPLSYAGRIVKVCWAVRVRVFQLGGRDRLIEHPFVLGGVAPPDFKDAPEAAKALVRTP